jgi:hypothetical protein
VDKFEAVVDGGLLSKFVNALCNRPLIHDLVRTACGSGRLQLQITRSDSMINHPLPQVVLTNDFRPKEKVGENPPDNDDAPIRSCEYTERTEERQTAGNGLVLIPSPSGRGLG